MMPSQHPACRRHPLHTIVRSMPLVLASSLLASSLLASGAAAANRHPVSITSAAVYLTRESATVRIEVFLEDLYLFHQLQPNRQDFFERSVIEQGIRLHEAFLKDRFHIADVEGAQVIAESAEVAAYELPDEGVPRSQLMGHRLSFTMRFLFDEPPSFLTFTQQFTDEEAVLPSETRLAVKQENAGQAVEQTLLPHIPFSLRISWDNPPLSPEASAAEQAEWQQRQRESMLGITSYSSVYSFVYVEPLEVRHEILAPLMTLDEDLLLSRDDDEVFDLSEQDLAVPQIKAYFASGNPILINGMPATPVVQRCDFFGLDMTDFAVTGKRRTVALANARVGIILAYRVDEPPRTVDLRWNRFNSSLWAVKTSVVTDDQIESHQLSRLGNRNRLHWETSETLDAAAPIVPVQANVPEPYQWEAPWASLLLGALALAVGLRSTMRQSGPLAMLAIALLLISSALWQPVRIVWQVGGPPPVATAEAFGSFRKLHANLYQAFRRRTEESIYDALAASVEGPLLEQVYLEVRRGLAMEDQGGAVARIRDVELLKLERPEEGSNGESGYKVRCQWNVSGTIEHWGHLHRRTRQYLADFRVRNAEGVWKIDAMDVVDQSQLESSTKLRE